MLDRLTAVRLASNHSPLRERREIFFATNADKTPGQKTTSDSIEGGTAEVQKLNDIEKIRQETHLRLQKVLGDLDNRNILNTTLQPIRAVLDDKRASIEKVLKGAETADSLAAAQKTITELESFASQYNQLRTTQGSIDDGKTNLYHRKKKTIYLQSDGLTSEQKKKLLEHEEMHAALHFLEEAHLLPGSFYDDLYTELEDKILGNGFTFGEQLKLVAENNAHYSIYRTADRGLLMEEVLVRHATWKQLPDLFKDKNECSLFSKLDTVDNKEILRIINKGSALSNERDPIRHSNNTHEEHESVETTTEKIDKDVNVNDVLRKTQQVIPKAEEIKDLYLAVDALAKDSVVSAKAKSEIQIIEKHLHTFIEVKEILELMQSWENGEDTIAALKTLLQRVGYEDSTSPINTFLSEKGLNESSWDQMTTSQRSTLAKDLGNRFDFKKITKSFYVELEDYNDHLEKVHTKISTAIGSLQEEKREGLPTKRIGNWFGVNFYSISEVMSVFSKITKAYSDAWTERTNRRENQMVSQVAEIVPKWPFGETVKNSLLRGADSELASPDEDELKYLQTNRIQFYDLFKEGGRMDQMYYKTSTTKKALAILDYAAERGWLFDIRKSDNRTRKILFGKYDLYTLLPSYWSEPRKSEYYLSLSTKNTGGIDHEIDHEYKGVHSVEKAPMFIEKFEHELHHMNYWGAIGIAKRALERGLASEIGPWLATTFIAHFEHNPLARRYAQNPEIFDKLGLLTFQNSFSTVSYFKWDRKSWLSYAENEKMSVKNAGVLGRTFGLIKEEILLKTHDHPPKPSKMNSMIAQVMAGKIVDVGGGKYVTIFDPKFAPFNAGPGKQSQIENIQKEDPDYYTDISDNIHADETVIKNGILAVTGSGAFQMKERAGYYAERLIQVYKEHKAKGLNTAAENFRSIIKPKLEAWLDFWYRDTRSQSLVGERFGKGNTDLQGKSIVVTLVKEGLIDFRLIEDAYHGKIKAHKGFVDSFIVEYFKEEPDVGKNRFPNSYK